MRNPTTEWLETDGLGGFASGSADGVRRRRYHALLIAALDPPAERRALVKGVELAPPALHACGQPLHEHLESAGLHHVSEIADADAPHSARGCPFQAWSLGELLRVVTRLNARDVAQASAAE